MATDAGRRLKDMLEILSKKAPSLCPNTVPKGCKRYIEDLSSIGSTDEQRNAIRSVLHRRRKEATKQLEDPRLVVITSVDIDAGTFHLCSAKYVSEVEADLYSVERILNLHSHGETDELTLRLEHFLSVNGYGSSSSSNEEEGGGEEERMVSAQEVYSLAYATSVCLSAAPIKAVIKGQEKALLSLPLEAGVDAGAVIEGLFDGGKKAKGGGGGSKEEQHGKKRLKKNK